MQRTRSKIPDPDIGMYGVFGPGYGQYLAADAVAKEPGNYASAFGSAATLRLGADNEARRYDEALRRAQELQVQASRSENEAGIMEKALAVAPDMIKLGAGRMLGQMFEKDPYGLFNPAGGSPYEGAQVLQAADISQLNEIDADRIGALAEASNQAAQSGVMPSPDFWQHRYHNPLEEEGTPLPGMITNYMSPHESTERYKATSRDERENIARIRAAGSGVKVKEVHNDNGELVSIEVTGPSKAAVDAAKAGYPAGIPTNTIIKEEPDEAITPDEVSPRADAQGGGASAITAADEGAAGFHSTTYGDMIDYRNPNYDLIEAEVHARHPTLPKNALRSLRLYGEKTNANLVSPDGAKTAYQITEDTRRGLMQNYGIADPWSSPEAAAEAAAQHVLESQRRGGDWAREYIGGPNWRNRTGRDAQDIAEYASRVYSDRARKDVSTAQAPKRGGRSVSVPLRRGGAAPPGTKTAEQYLAIGLKQPGVVGGETTGDHVILYMANGSAQVYLNGRLIRG